MFKNKKKKFIKSNISDVKSCHLNYYIVKFGYTNLINSSNNLITSIEYNYINYDYFSPTHIHTHTGHTHTGYDSPSVEANITIRSMNMDELYRCVSSIGSNPMDYYSIRKLNNIELELSNIRENMIKGNIYEKGVPKNKRIGIYR